MFSKLSTLCSLVMHAQFAICISMKAITQSLSPALFFGLACCAEPFACACFVRLAMSVSLSVRAHLSQVEAGASAGSLVIPGGAACFLDSAAVYDSACCCTDKFVSIHVTVMLTYECARVRQQNSTFGYMSAYMSTHAHAAMHTRTRQYRTHFRFYGYVSMGLDTPSHVKT